MVPTSPLEAMAQWGRMVALAPSLTLEYSGAWDSTIQDFDGALSIRRRNPLLQFIEIVSGIR